MRIIKSHADMRHDLRQRRALKKSLNVVVTGGSRGLGKALVQEFAKQGDKVYVLARSESDLKSLTEGGSNVYYRQFDIRKTDHIPDLMNGIVNDLGSIDMWINNAAISGGYRPFLDLDDTMITSIMTTNLLSTCLLSKSCQKIMQRQDTGGAIFNIAGAGSDGRPTLNYSMYGATKSAIIQLSKTLKDEWRESTVDVHVISPGMMGTSLLMDNLPADTLRLIEFMCTDPKDVVFHLVPRMKEAYYFHESSYIRFMTLLKIAGRFIRLFQT